MIALSPVSRAFGDVFQFTGRSLLPLALNAACPA
jgi:hypothetical protein